MKIMDTNKPIDLEDEIEKLETSILNSNKKNKSTKAEDYSSITTDGNSGQDETQDTPTHKTPSWTKYLNWIYLGVPVVVGSSLYAIQPKFVMKKKKKKLDTQKFIIYSIFISIVIVLAIYFVKKYKYKK